MTSALAGSSIGLTTTLKDGDGTLIDWDTFEGIVIFFTDPLGKIIARFSKNALDGFAPITVDSADKNIKYFIEGSQTAGTKGTICREIKTSATDSNYASGINFQTLQTKQVFEIIPAVSATLTDF